MLGVNKCKILFLAKIYNEAQTQGESLKSVVKYDTYQNIYKLHVVSILVASASYEQSFSSMRRINTYLR